MDDRSKSDKIKILAVSTSGFSHKEGISTVILDNFSRFDKDLFELHIAVAGAYSEELTSQFEQAGIVIQYLPSRKKNLPAYIKSFVSLFKKEKYNAFYIHGSSAIMGIDLLLSKLCGCKVRVVHSHNTTCSHKKADKLLRPVFYKLYTDAIACGEDAGKWLYGGRPFLLLKNGRDVEKYRYNINTRNQIRESLNVKEDELLIGHVGNFNKQKNQKYALQILNEVLKKQGTAKLFLMGEGPLLTETKELAASMGIQSQVVFTGSVTNVPEMLQAMDVMILPSLHEGLPLVAIEWQIAALPCFISTKVTTECSYSDLVNFISLDDPAVWADRILAVQHTDRSGIADTQIALTQKAGYDINQNAVELQHFFMERCKGKQ